MEDTKAAEILKSLASGTSPAGDGPLPEVPALQSPDVVRALFMAADSLEARARLARRNAGLPRNAGKTWSAEEDERLLAGCDGGATVAPCCAVNLPPSFADAGSWEYCRASFAKSAPPSS